MTKKETAQAFAGEGYNIEITGRHVLVTDAMKDYAIEKISKIERFTDRILDVVVTMDIQKLEHRVDIVMKVNNLKIRSSATSSDMYVSIDMAVAKIEKQLLRYKRRLQDHHARPVKEVDMTVNVIRPHQNDDLNEINDMIEGENKKRMEESLKPHEVVSQERKVLKTITLDEAIMKMELSQDAFIVYQDEVTHKIHILYRRDDGNYGLIEPKIG
ncbi:MAG: ribosome-associated translation inhibitor RaiA [Chlamydiia bacterium]|nr:ribosome-associated translation inhibitor RaiA [Chlamydiia bacterium]